MKNNSVKPKVIELSSGLKVVLISMKETRTTTIMILVKAGSEYEKKKKNGISHFLEHMCFKGTKKRPSSIEISYLLERLGAHFGAFTGQEFTGFYTKLSSKYLDTALDVISDIYLNSLFQKKEIDREKGVIIEEMNLDEDTPTSQIYDVFINLLYGDQPAGWNILGEREVIKNIKRKDFVDYKAKHYTADKTLVVISGKFKEKEIVSTLEKRFKKINRKNGAEKPKTIESQQEPNVSIKYKKTDQAHFIFGTRAFSLFDKRRYALEILSNILGGGISSRLFQKVREEMGAAYYISSMTDLDIDHGFLGVSTGVSLNKIDDVLKVIKKEFENLSSKLVSAKELNKAKDYLKGAFDIGLET